MEYTRLGSGEGGWHIHGWLKDIMLIKKVRHKWVHTIWFQLYQVQKQTKLIQGIRCQRQFLLGGSSTDQDRSQRTFWGRYSYAGWQWWCSHSCQTLVTPWTVACQAPQFTGFPRQEYWSGLPKIFELASRSAKLKLDFSKMGFFKK